MFTSNELLSKVNDFIANLSYDRKPESIYAPIKYVLSIGGKRIRPVLMLLSYNLYKDNPESILMQACALETYHNYTLLHDDLMDNADVRRGMPTVHRKWDANTAILSGDSMLVLAYQRMAQCAPSKLKPVLDLFTETALEIGEGQQYDMDFERRTDVTEAEYIEMIRLKTSVLLACAMKTGAILADAPAADADRLYQFGEQIGLAFQLQDDYLDVYGDPAIFGKKIGGDIINDKKTYLLIEASQQAQADDLALLNRCVGNKDITPEEKIEVVTGIYNHTGADKLCTEKMKAYYHAALSCMDEILVPEDRKLPLLALAGKLMKRDH